VKAFKFIDSVLVDQPTETSIRSQAIGIAGSGKNPRLKVTMDATHSGVITNRRVYPGTKVQKGYKTFFSKTSGGEAEYDKPVLRHHSIDQDPIGRIIKATFTPLKNGQEFDFDYKMPDPEGSKGSGVVTIDAIISDPESIQKIIDGRYLSISVGHSTDSVACSICGDNIFRCEHTPGRMYGPGGEELETDEASEMSEAKLCYYITGNMQYNEASFVNMPAQPPAKLLNFQWEDCNKHEQLRKDNILIESMSRGKKAMVRAFSLQDESGEYNLLKGTSQSANKKTIIDMAGPKATPNIDNVGSEETSNVPQVTTPKSKKDVHMDSGRTEEKSKPKERINMDNEEPKVTDSGLDPSVLSASLEALTKERERMQKELSAASTKITTLEKTIETKSSEIERLSKAQTDMQVEMSKALATALASVRAQLKKPDTNDIDSLDKFTNYSDKLSKRSVESLKDSLADLILELSDKMEVEVKSEAKNVNEIVSQDKVTTPVPVDSKNTVQAGSKKPSKTQDNFRKPIDQVFGD
jgi:hypothetical protein